ncbi:MAG: ABC transporter permease subunit [Planctomycetia bacterium]|nr:ABC transporter permease subunit [Planctomycetia bacterium]
MFFGPIVTLELVTGARRLRYFVLRALYAAILLLVMWSAYSSSPLRWGDTTRQAVAEFSAAFFTTFAFAQVIAVLFVAPAMIAGTIAQERERRTIEYLLASTLTSAEIVMSKFLGRTVHVAAMLLVGLPILALAMLLGGIGFEALLTAFVVTLATLVAVAALSIGTSVWAKRGRDAVIRTYVFLFAFLVIPPLLFSLQGSVWDWLAWLPLVGGALFWANPLTAVGMVVFGRPMFGTTKPPWVHVAAFAAVYAAFSTVVLTWAILSLRRVYRKSIGSSPPVRRRFLSRRTWRPRPGNRPMLWKELFAETAAVNLGRTGQIVLLLLFGAAVVRAILIAFYSPHPRLNEELFLYVAWMGTVLECAALLGVGTRAAGSIAAEKERDSWATLVSTPLSAAEIIWAKMAGSIYSVRWIGLPLAILWGLAALFEPAILLVVPVLLTVFAVIALAISALGAWFSLWCKTSIRAISATVAVGTFLGGGYLLCCAPMMFGVGGGGGEEIILAPCIPFLFFVPNFAWIAYFLDPYGIARQIGKEEMRFAVVWFFGMAGYVVLGLVMTAVTIGSFDDLVGRPRRLSSLWPSEPGPPRPQDGALTATPGDPTAG